MQKLVCCAVGKSSCLYHFMSNQTLPSVVITAFILQVDIHEVKVFPNFQLLSWQNPQVLINEVTQFFSFDEIMQCFFKKCVNIFVI
jgi:hypothetical protein